MACDWTGVGRLRATRRAVVGCGLAHGLAGCAEPLTYEPPVLWTPDTWRNPLLTVAPVRPEWWLAFNDPVLAGLMARAGGNPQVRLATARIPTDRAPFPSELWTRRGALVSARAAAASAYVRLRARDSPHARNALTWRLGLLPGELDAVLRARAPVPATPARVDAGPPATLARRRPDIRLAEEGLRAAGPDEARSAAASYQLMALRALTEVDNAALSLAAAQQAGDGKASALAFVAVQAALGTGWEPPAGT